MKKKLILVAAPPASGKTYVSEIIAKEIGNTVYLDKDDLCDLVRNSFALCGKEFDMDCEFYRDKIRPAEYSTVLHIAHSAIRFNDTVILNAPFGKEVRNAKFMRSLREKTNAAGAELWLIWVHTPTELCKARMEERGAERDIMKLENWEAYVKKVNYSIPYELEGADALDRFIVFDNENDETFSKSLDKVLGEIKGGYTSKG